MASLSRPHISFSLYQISRTDYWLGIRTLKCLDFEETCIAKNKYGKNAIILKKSAQITITRIFHPEICQ